MEVGMWNLLAAKHHWQSVRGGRHNQDCGAMKYPPRAWTEEENDKSEKSGTSEKADEEVVDCPHDPAAKVGGVGLAAYFA